MPASIIDAAVGAATWPVGAQVWNGHMPARMANPTNTSGNAQSWKDREKGKPASSGRLKLDAPETTKAANNPTSTIALPTKEYSESFIAPYSFRVEPQIAMRKYLGMIASS